MSDYDDSEYDDQDSSDEPLPEIKEPVKRIDSINELFEYLGCTIENERPDEIALKPSNSHQVLKIPRQAFSEFCIRCSRIDTDFVQPDSGAGIHSGMGEVEKRDPKQSSKAKLNGVDDSPATDILAASNLEMDNLRVADETTLGRASISNKGVTDRTNEEEEKSKPEPEKKDTPDKFTGIFAQLDPMGDEDTLFDGIDDDVFSTPKAKPEPKSMQQANIGNLHIDTLNIKQNEEVKLDGQIELDKKQQFKSIKTKTMKVSNNKIVDHEEEIDRLKEELRIKSSEIERLTMQIHQYSRDPDLVPHHEPSVHSSSYHLAFMFSSPLVRKINSNLEMIMQLDYINEIRNIEKQLKHVKHEVKYKVSVATISNFRSVIAEAPFALHFTGHGIRNDPKALGPSYMQYKDKGDILLLEDEKGMADYLFESDLMQLVKMSKSSKEFANHYEVVFVSSCYSEFTAKIFLLSGARHVICINKDQRISDKASLKFSQVFYDYLFIKSYSVCEAFTLAKEDIRSCINQGEANKFILYVNDNVEHGSKKKKTEHKCFPLTKFNPGGLTKEEVVALFDSVPSTIDNFKGRQQEMYEVITLLHSNRLVNILGPPGIGKTSFVRNLCNHIKDRKKFYDGILYVSLRGCQSGHMFLTRLSLTMQATGRIDEAQFQGIGKIAIKENSNNEDWANEQDEHKMKNFILQILREREVLIVLDSCEDPLEDDGAEFVKHLDFLLGACSSTKFLLTSRKYLNKLEHYQEMPYHLFSLPPQPSIKLLFAKAPREIDNDEIEELLNYEIPSNHPINQHFPKISKTEVNLSNHPFILMLGGHPQAICLAAPMLENQSLLELFQQLLDTNIMDLLGFQENQSYTSLRLSLEISIKNMKKNHSHALELFKFIGLMPGGVNQNELTEMWGNTSWKSHRESLIRASLLVFKQQESILTLLPFMNTRAYELLEEDGEEQKIKYHLKICKFYKDYCEKFLNSIDKPDQDSFVLNDFVEKESNIWACIYRSINRKKDNNEYDEENDNSRQILAKSFKSANYNAFKDFAYNRVNTTSNPLPKSNRDIIKPKPEVSAIVEEDEYMAMDSDNFSKLSIRPSEFNSRLHSGDVSIDITGGNASRFGKLNEKENKEQRPSKTTTKFQNTIAATKLGSRIDMNMKRKTSDQLKVEEMLVVYYVSIVIRMSKISDGKKAITEYNKKKGLSKLALAHIYKILGVLTMLSEKRDYKKAQKYFTKSIEYFTKIQSPVGLAITMLALVRCECELEFTKVISKKEDLDRLVKKTIDCKTAFSKIDHKLGLERTNLYIDCLKNKLCGADMGNFRKTLKSTTLKSKNFTKTKAKESLLLSDMLQDEDIKLFLEVNETSDSDLIQRLISNEDEKEYRTPQISSVKRRKFDGNGRNKSEDSTQIRSHQQLKTKLEFKRQFKPNKRGSKSKPKRRPKNHKVLKLDRPPSIDC